MGSVENSLEIQLSAIYRKFENILGHKEPPEHTREIWSIVPRIIEVSREVTSNHILKLGQSGIAADTKSEIMSDMRSFIAIYDLLFECIDFEHGLKLEQFIEDIEKGVRIDSSAVLGFIGNYTQLSRTIRSEKEVLVGSLPKDDGGRTFSVNASDLAVLGSRLDKFFKDNMDILRELQSMKFESNMDKNVKALETVGDAYMLPARRREPQTKLLLQEISWLYSALIEKRISDEMRNITEFRIDSGKLLDLISHLHRGVLYKRDMIINKQKVDSCLDEINKKGSVNVTNAVIKRRIQLWPLPRELEKKK